MTIDDTWYQRPLGLPERISSGGIGARWENGEALIALVREKDMQHFVLSKGGIERGENLEQAARREIAEEAGLTTLHLVEKMGVRERLTYDKNWWAVIHYFLFTTEQKEGMPTDADHDDSPYWFPVDNLPVFLWPEQRKLVEIHRALIVQSARGAGH